MGSRLNHKLKKMLYPYTFVLKEGKKIEDDFMDYSLLILQMGQQEVLKSPHNYKGPTKLENFENLPL